MIDFKKAFTVLTTALMLSSCQEAEKTAESKPATLTEEERERFAEAGKDAIGDLAQTLGSRLKEAIEEGGPVSAVRVCEEVAQSITQSVGAERDGITIGRTALRYRNPKNAPDKTDERILRSWEARKAEGDILPDHELVKMDQGMVRFYKPIMLQPICLNCHGPDEQLLPELKTLLDELYPEDQARNFQVGDLRGVFRVEMTPASIAP